MQIITFTAIPKGRTDFADGTSKWRISVLVSPKLSPGGVPPALRFWPEYCRNLRFNVQLAKAENGTVRSDTINQVPSATGLASAQDGSSFGSGSSLYQHLFSDAQSKGFSEQRINKNTTFKTYDSESVSKCLHRISSRLFLAALTRQDIPADQQSEQLRSEMEILIRDHVPFKVASLPQRAEQPHVLNPPPAPTAPPAAVVLGAQMVAGYGYNAIGNPPELPPAHPDYLTSITNGLLRTIQSQVDAFRGLISDVESRANIRPSPDSLQRATSANAVFNRDSFRIQDTAAEPLHESASRDVVALSLRQVLGSKLADKLKNPLLDAMAFWQRLRRSGDSTVENLMQSQKESHPDFHQRWSLLGNYPALFHALGMVVDLEWTGSAQDRDTFSNNQVISVSLALAPGLEAFQFEFPWVAYEASKFQPASLDRSVQDGYLKLSNESFHLETADLDGGSQKAAQFFISWGRKLNANPNALVVAAAKTPEDLLPPTTRTVGIVLSCKTRQDDVANAFKKSNSFDAASNVLYAEDLVRGYVIDLWASPSKNQTGKWYSLCRRDENFRIRGEEPFLSRTAEGSIKPCVIESNTKPEGQSPISEMYMLQSIVHWNGNYLSVPAEQYGAIEKEGNSIEPPTLWQLDTKMGPPKTDGKIEEQPPLRVGAAYRLAVRVEFLDGQIATFDQNPVSMLPAPSDGPLELKRYEPISAPVILMTEPSCRETHQKDVFDLVLHSHTKDDLTWKTVERLVAPPRVEERVARLHIGKDNAVGLVHGLRRLKQKSEDGSLIADDPSVFDGTAKVPYLPDPIAREITVWLEDHVERKLSGPFRIPLAHHHRAPWPDYLVHLIKLQAAKLEEQSSVTSESTWFAFAPGLSYDSRTIQVSLPPAHIATLTIKCGFGTDGRGELAQMAWWDRALSLEPMYRSTEEAALRGDHPLLCCPVSLTLTHALRVPLTDASIRFQSRDEMWRAPSSPKSTRKMLDWVLVRENDKSIVESSLPVTFDRKSTGKIRANVTWSEARDNGSGAIESATGSAIALEEPIAGYVDKPETEEDQQKPCIFKFDPGNTKYCKLSVQATAISRFRDYFPTEENEACSRTSNAVDVELLSNRNPDPPEVLYIVPTFRWDNNALEQPKRFWNKRNAAGLRIFLGGRWCSSGDDELLGVIIHQDDEVVRTMADPQKRSQIPFLNPADASQATAQNPAPADERFVSVWGGNAIFAMQVPSEQLFLTGWDSRIDSTKSGERPDVDPRERIPDGACGWNLSVPGANPATIVAVVGYKPYFDQLRNSWYCDVSFSRAPTYGTFVRLALARYQPHAKPGLELSTIQLSGFSVINPDRTVIVQPKRIRVQNSEKDGLAITIWGVANLGGIAGKNVFEVSLERETYRGTRSLGWEHELAVPEMWSDDFGTSRNSNEQVIWYGEVSIDSCATRRILVREFEQYESEEGTNVVIGKRLVYADVVEIR